MPIDEASQRLADVRARIARAARIAGREADAVTLIAISKTHDADAIRPLIRAGQRVFGENRVQEAEGKWPALREAAPDVALHLVGQLQSNKAEDAVALFDAIHSVDRPVIATCPTGKRACTAKADPLRCLQLRQWQTEIRTGSPTHSARSWPQRQAAVRTVTSPPCAAPAAPAHPASRRHPARPQRHGPRRSPRPA